MDDIRVELSRRLGLVDFLAERGIRPARQYGDKSVYSCPIHHGDKTPSFYVYQKEDGRQDCYCFGCKFYGDIVRLKAKLDSTSQDQAFAELASRCGFDPESPDAIIDDCVSIVESMGSVNNDIDEIRFMIVELTASYRVHRAVGPVSETWGLVWARADDAARNGDLEALINARPFD